MGNNPAKEVKYNLVFDVGANVGTWAEYYLNQGSKVIAIEPQKHCFDRLIDKFGDNPNFTALNIGLADQPGTLKFWRNSYDQISTFSYVWKTESKFGNGTRYEKGWQEAIEVEVSTLDLLIAEYGIPDLCKIDVEGFELKVIKGLSQKIGHICFEFTEQYLGITQGCLNHLKGIGYQEYQILYGSHLGTTPDAEWHVIDTPVGDKCARSANGLRTWGDIFCR